MGLLELLVVVEQLNETVGRGRGGGGCCCGLQIIAQIGDDAVGLLAGGVGRVVVGVAAGCCSGRSSSRGGGSSSTFMHHHHVGSLMTTMSR